MSDLSKCPKSLKNAFKSSETGVLQSLVVLGHFETLLQVNVSNVFSHSFQ